MKPRPVAGTHLVGRADLHVHTTHSDGTFSPCQVIVAAARVGLAAVSITDHDTVSALAVTRVEATRWPVRLIAGVELTCSLAGRSLHLLGYHVRDDDPALLRALDWLRTARVDRMNEIAALLRTRSLHVDLDTIRRLHPRATLGRKQVADYLVRTGQAASVRDAFERYLGDHALDTIPKPRLDVLEAIELVRGAGGVAAWAHPPFDTRFSALESLAEAGMHAVEVEGPGFTKKLTTRLRDWADALGLIGTAGTDFHAADRPGRWVGAISTPAEALERLERAAGQGPRLDVSGQASKQDHASAVRAHSLQ